MMHTTTVISMFLLVMLQDAWAQEIGQDPIIGSDQVIKELKNAQAKATKAEAKAKELQGKVDNYEERLQMLEEGLLSSLAELQEKDIACEGKISQIEAARTEAPVERINCAATEEFLALKRENEEMKKQNEDLKKEKEEFKNKNEDYNKKNEELKSAFDKMQSQFNELKESNTKLMEVNKNLVKEKEQIEGKNSKLSAELGKCQKDLNTSSETIDKITSDVDSLNSTLEECINDNIELNRNITDLKEQSENIDDRIKEFQNKITNLENINKDSKFQLISLVNELQKCQSFSQNLQENSEECERENNLLDAKLGSMKIQTDKLMLQNEQCNEQLSELQDESENYNKLNNICNLKLDQMKQQNASVQSKKNNCDTCEQEKSNFAQRIKELNEMNRVCENDKNREMSNSDYFRNKYNVCIGQLQNEQDLAKKNPTAESKQCPSTNPSVLTREINTMKTRFVNCNSDLQTAKTEIIRIQILITICNRKSTEFLERIGIVQKEINNKNLLLLEMKKIFAKIYKTAMLFKEEQKYGESLKILVLILEAEKMIYGPDDQEIIISMNAISHVLYLMDRFEEALPINRNALEKCMGVLGENHSLTLQVLNNLAVLQIARKDMVDASRLFKILLVKQKELLGNNHPDTHKTLRYLASIGSYSSMHHGYY